MLFRSGIVQLKDGLGVTKQGFYTVTTPPAIANGVAAIGGFVLDGQETGEPSGVIRGYDVVTGKLDVREAAAKLPDEVLTGTAMDAADVGEELDVADQGTTA